MQFLATNNLDSRYQFKVEVEVRDENGEEVKNERL